MADTITRESPDTNDARDLIGELDEALAPFYPKSSRHGYSVDKLIASQVAFFVLRHDGVPAACGGVQIYGHEYAEVKRMYVRPQFRGLGLAKKILDHLKSYARSCGAPVLRLETGMYQKEAIALYEGYGFKRRDEFGEYSDEPLSLYFELSID